MTRPRRSHALLAFAAAMTVSLSLATPSRADDPWLDDQGRRTGPGKGKHVVLVSGDEEYRSEEALPQLAKILAKHHGFNCTVLFAVDDQGRDQPHTHRQHSRPGGAEDGRPDGDLHPLPRPARRPDEAHRRLRRVGQADHRHAHRDARLQPQAGAGLRQVHLDAARSGTAASAGRCWAKPGSTTTAITASRARAASSRRGRRDTPDPARHQGRRHLGPDRRLRRPPALARRQQAAGPRPGARGHEPDRQARRRPEERADDAGRLDQDLHRQGGQARARLHDDDGRLARPGERGHPADARQRLLLGPRPGGQDPREERRDDRRRVQAAPVRLRRASRRASSRRTWRGIEHNAGRRPAPDRGPS